MGVGLWSGNWLRESVSQLFPANWRALADWDSPTGLLCWFGNCLDLGTSCRSDASCSPSPFADDGKLSLEEFQLFFADGVLNETELEGLFHTIDSDNTK